MADAVLTLDARYTGRRQVRQAERDILKVKLASAGAHSEFNKVAKSGDRMINAMGKSGQKFKRMMTDWDKLVRGFGTVISKVFAVATKMFVAEFALMAASMVAVHALFKIGRWLMKGYHGAIKMIAGAAAGATAALAILSAAIREQQAAMFSYKGLKGNYADLTSGVSAVRAQMRGMATDVRLATLGVENLNTIFSGASQRGTYSQGLAKGLLDVAHAGRSGADAAKWIGEVVGLLTDPKVQWGEIEKAFRGMGKEGERTMEKIREAEIKTVSALKNAIKSGELSVIAGMEGQFDAVAGTLMSKLKGAFTIIRTDFADLGDAFMGDTKEAVDDIVHIFRRMFVRIHGSILRFGSGGFLSSLVSGAEYIERNMVKLVSKWLPMAEGMFGRISDWWDNFKLGWEQVTNSLEPLIQSAEIIEDMFRRILVPMGEYLKDAFGDFGVELARNSEGFEQFGDSVGNMITQFFGLTTEIKKLWLESMPFISKVIDGLSQMFEVVAGLVRVIGGVFGGIGAGMKGFAPMAALMFMRMGGKQLRNNRGTVVPPTSTTGTMNVTAGSVNVNGRPTGVTKGGNIGGPPVGGPGYVPPGGGGGQMPGQQRLFDDRGAKGLTSRAGGAGRGVVSGRTVAGGVATGGAAAPGGPMIMGGARGRLSQWAGNVNKQATGPNSPLSRYQRFRTNKIAPMLTGRGAAGISRVSGSMGGKMGAMMGMGILGGFMPEEAQGAMAMGSMLSMIDPRLGLAVGLGGAALNSRTTAGGMVTGAGAGAALGAYAGPYGMAAGAIIGGIAGSIAGALGEKRHLTKEVKAAAKDQAQEIWDSMVEGIREVSERYGMVGVTGQRAKQALGLEGTRDMMDLATQGLNFADNPIGDGSVERSWMDWATVIAADIAVGAITTAAIVGSAGTLTAPALAFGIAASGAVHHGMMGVGAFGETTGGPSLQAGYEGLTGHEARQRMIEQVFARQDEFGITMTEQQKQQALVDPKAWMQEMGAEVLPELVAGEMAIAKYTQRMNLLTDLTDQSAEGIHELAEAVGLNLFDATMETSEMIRQLANSMVGTAEQINQLFAEVKASIFDLFRIEVSRDEAEFALDEAATSLRDLYSSGDLDEEAATKFLADSLNMYTAIFGGDEAAGLKAFVADLGVGGALYQQENGMIQGMEGAVLQGTAADIMDLATVRVATAQQRVDQELVQSIAMKLGQEGIGIGSISERERLAIGEAEERLLAVGDMPGALPGATQTQIDEYDAAVLGAQTTLASILNPKNDSGVAGGFSFQKLEGVIGRHGAEALNETEVAQLFHDSTLQFGTSVEQFAIAMNSVIGMFGAAPANAFDLGMENKDFEMNAEATGAFLSAWQAATDKPTVGEMRNLKDLYNASEISNDVPWEDSAFYRGDTSSAFAGTMAAHNRISSGIAGKRLITSGQRNFALGSSTSDHLTGRALDLTGNNLGAYGDRVRAGGGFAEMHGVSGSRHLHAVPAGDTASSRGMSGGTSGTYNYTINVTGGPDAGAEEVAMLVMTEIQNIEKSNRERA